MISIHYSWWLFQKINQKSLNKDIGHEVRTISWFMDIMLKSKVVHLSTIHGKHLKSHRSSFNRQTVIFIAKGSSSSYNSLPVSLGKKSLFPYYASYSYTKGEMVRLPKVTFGLPNPWFSQCFIFFPKNFYKILINTKQTGPLWGGSRLVF